MSNHSVRSGVGPALMTYGSWQRIEINNKSKRDIARSWSKRPKSKISSPYCQKEKEKASANLDADFLFVDNSEGHESVNSLKEAYKAKITELRRTASTLPTLQQADESQSSQSLSKNGLSQQPPPPPSPVASSASFSSSSSSSASSSSSSSAINGGAPGIKPLSSYVDVEKLSNLPRKEIEYIWRLRFASNPLSLCAVIPLETYQRIYTNARLHPQFILPLPRPSADDGSNDVKQADSGFDAAQPRTAADIHFLQWGFHPPAGDPPVPGTVTHNNHVSTVLFTHLAAFKVHGAYAQPHTTVTHHLDLADSHGIVLLQGAVVDGRGVSPDEATWLLMCLQKFYDFQGHGGGVGREKRQGLLEKFSRGDAEGFKIEELMDEAERVS